MGETVNTEDGGSLEKVEDTVMQEYLGVIQKEYEFERNKKQSFESRSSLIITLIGALCIFAFDKISLNTLKEMMGHTLTMGIIMKISLITLFYISLGYTFWKLYKVITVGSVEVFPLSLVENSEIVREKCYGLSVIIMTYKELVKSQRETNNQKAKNLKKAIWGMGILLVILIVYINL